MESYSNCKISSTARPAAIACRTWNNLSAFIDRGSGTGYCAIAQSELILDLSRNLQACSLKLLRI